MGTVKIQQISTLLATVLFASIAFAGGFSATGNLAQLEGTIGCRDGRCFASNAALKVPGLPDFSSLVQHVNICGEDDRVPAVNLPETEALRAMGLVTTNQPVKIVTASKESGNSLVEKNEIAHAGAFLVGPCLALINYHGVFGNSDEPLQDNFDPSKYSVTLQFDRGAGKQPIVTKARAMNKAWGGYNPQLAVTDWALLEVKDCPGKELGWFSFGKLDSKAPETRELKMAAFASDKVKRDLWVDPSCHAYSWKTGSWEHDCASRPVSSGGLMYIIEEGLPVVVGMHTGPIKHHESVVKGQCKGDDLNLAVSMGSIPNRIKALINDDIKAFGQPNPMKRVKEPSTLQGQTKVTGVKPGAKST